MDDEKALKMKGRGRPKAQQAKAKAKAKAQPKSQSRCAAVRRVEAQANADPRQSRTEGVFATLDMRSGEVLHFGEMLNAERTSYKEAAAVEVAAHVKIGVYCHDCACVLDFEGRLCERCLLDKWHALKHKCSKPRFDPAHRLNEHWVRGCNTQAAEQLWSRTDKLAPFCMAFGRGCFRLFLRRYCVWRNGFVRSHMRRDASGIRSRKAALKRGEAPYKPLRKRPAAAAPPRKRPAAAPPHKRPAAAA